MEEKIKEMEDERGYDKGERKEGKGWFGEECKRKKKKVRGLMKEWRRKGGKCEKRAKDAKRESDVCEIIRKERKEKDK